MSVEEFCVGHFQNSGQFPVLLFTHGCGSYRKFFPCKVTSWEESPVVPSSQLSRRHTVVGNWYSPWRLCTALLPFQPSEVEFENGSSGRDPGSLAAEPDSGVAGWTRRAGKWAEGARMEKGVKASTGWGRPCKLHWGYVLDFLALHFIYLFTCLFIWSEDWYTEYRTMKTKFLLIPLLPLLFWFKINFHSLQAMQTMPSAEP